MNVTFSNEKKLAPSEILCKGDTIYYFDISMSDTHLEESEIITMLMKKIHQNGKNYFEKVAKK